MAKKVTKAKAEPKEAPKKETPKAAEPKVVSSKRIATAKVDRSAYASVEATLLKDHGADKKGDKISRHPNTMDMLREKGIVK